MSFNKPLFFRRSLFFVAIVFVASTSPNWAQSTLYIFLGSIYFFKEEIGKLLLRFKSFGKDGIDTYHPQAQQIVETATGSISDISKNVSNVAGKNLSQTRINAIENFGKGYPAVEELITQIEEELEGYQKSDPEKINLLTRHTAALQFFLWCESTYEPMFGSQIQLLGMLLNAPRSFNEVSDYFANMKQKFPNAYKDWDTNRYMNYLSTSNLVYLDEAFNYRLTKKGEDFLRWLLTHGKNPKIGGI